MLTINRVVNEAAINLKKGNGDMINSATGISTHREIAVPILNAQSGSWCAYQERGVGNGWEAK